MQLIKSQDLKVPHGNSFVWRYMDWDKFKQVLENSSLFFANAQQLSDQYEVTFPESSIVKKQKKFKSKGLRHRCSKEEMDSRYRGIGLKKEQVLINCWSVNRYESYALWKIYLGGNKNGVAIQSTVSSLREAVVIGNDDYPEEFFIGEVQYKKHLNPDELSKNLIITTKKPFYDFEKELRLFIITDKSSKGAKAPPYDTNKGRKVRVDLPVLINRVFISPFADEDFKKKVKKNILKIKGLSGVAIKDSEIRDR